MLHFIDLVSSFMCKMISSSVLLAGGREEGGGKREIKTERQPAKGARTSVQVYDDDAVGEERNKIWRSRLLAWSLHLSPGVSRVSQG